MHLLFAISTSAEDESESKSALLLYSPGLVAEMNSWACCSHLASYIADCRSIAGSACLHLQSSGLLGLEEQDTTEIAHTRTKNFRIAKYMAYRVFVSNPLNPRFFYLNSYSSRKTQRYPLTRIPSTGGI
jgi:hypothetical protein